MEIAWLEDFLAVLEHGGFSRAAEARHITQSALSRRIRALEEWVGTPLLIRTTHSVRLTPSGEAFQATAEETLRRLAAGRTEALELAQGASDLLRFASTNALSWVFFPVWLRRVEATLPFGINVQLVANHMEACERMMIAGQVQFLLCHHHDAAKAQLNDNQFRSLHVGDDVLLPISAPRPDGGGEPLFALPGSPELPVPYVSYRPESGMGRIVAAAQGSFPSKIWLKPTFTSHLAKLLVTMALDGRGMGWAPKSLIEDSLETGDLVRAGDSRWDIPIQIHLYRSRARQSLTAERFWSHLESIAASKLGPVSDNSLPVT
ncbi:LysR family transcriptional regulator [Azospirillum sp. TSO22-1]|uniref:LysR family transcriptional regulator n=1 Tax=Azospirillum sp. TSO22-1 TaxID=716789 RepID=UPI000D615B9A|nr:LysR family transcriptional regulator [Azospirillum sp. TSO22-1]PWC40345.1 LysR family transcriptional regulator [Azospirillum sp. TSO22-1]